MSGNDTGEVVPTSLQRVDDWAGDDDPENPRNFTLTRRILSTLAVTWLAFVSTFAASIYSEAHDGVSREFGVSEEVSLLPLSLFNLGLAFGPLVGAPMSEQYGRKAVFVATTPVFALFTLGAGFAPNVAALTICRFFAGMFAAPAISNASATIVDYTAGPARAIYLSFYYSVPTFGAVLAPFVGGFVVQARGWRWTFWTTLFAIALFYIPVLFTRESYKKTILQRRAKRLGLEVPNQRKGSLLNEIHRFITTLLTRPIHMVLTEPIVTLVCLYCGFLFGLTYTFVVASPWVYEHVYAFNKISQTLSFLGLITGALFAPLPLILIDLKLYQPRLKTFYLTHRSHERFPPENRLYAAMLGSFCLPNCLFLFAWTTRPSIHWIVPIVFQALTSLSSLQIYASANLYMLDSYGPLYGASASGAAMLSRYLLSAAFPLFALQMYERLGVGWATSLLGFCTLAMAPIPWLFWRFGARLRARSRYESSA